MDRKQSCALIFRPVVHELFAENGDPEDAQRVTIQPARTWRIILSNIVANIHALGLLASVSTVSV